MDCRLVAEVSTKHLVTGSTADGESRSANATDDKPDAASSS